MGRKKTILDAPHSRNPRNSRLILSPISDLALENDLHPQLHSAGASGPKNRVRGCNVRRRTGQAQVRGRGTASHSSCRLGKNRMIEDIEKLAAELDGESFADFLSLAHGHVQVPIARTVEQTLGHGSEDSGWCRSNCRTALRPAAVRRKSG